MVANKLLSIRRRSQIVHRIIALVFSLFFLMVQSQNRTSFPENLTEELEVRVASCAKESVYLQTSKGVYETGEDLWFKGYVLDSQYLIPSLESSTLYVQLIHEFTKDVVWQEKYEIENGFVDGHAYVQDTLTAGSYLLEAYTASSIINNRKDIQAIRKLSIVKRITESSKTTSSKKNHNSLAKDSIQFGLFPEGGHLVAGIKSRVAFKATNQKGLPVQVSGAVYENDTKLQDVKSLYIGMGSFEFTPNLTSRYRIKLDDPYDKQIYHLPKIASQGKILTQLENTDKTLTLKVSQSISNAKEMVYVRVQVRGEVYSIAKTFLDQTATIKIPLQDVPQGIAEVALFDKDLIPIAERLVYIKQDQKLYIKAVLDKKVYFTKEGAKLNIKVTDQYGNPVVAHLGVSVYDNLYTNKKDVKTIESHYFLSTQLKGKIHNPSYYFDKDNEHRKQALDLLLLTQGWRSYEWNRAHLQEVDRTNTIALKDEIQGEFNYLKKKKNLPKQTTLLVYDPLKEKKKSFVSLDSMGNFLLTREELKMGRRLYIKHFAGKEKVEVVIKDPFKEIKKITSEKEYSYPLSFEQKEEQEGVSFLNRWNRIQAGSLSLDKVTLKAKKSSVFRDKYLAKLDSLAKVEMTADYVCVNNFLNCPIHLPGTSSNKKPVEGEIYLEYLVWQDGEFVRGIAPIEGEGFINPALPPYYYPSLTEAFLMERFHIKSAKGYYPKKEFYEPVYDDSEQLNGFPDFRNTLYWKPDVLTDKNGEATIRFHCSDINTLFVGTIEGVSGEGLLGTQSFEFFVKKKK